MSAKASDDCVIILHIHLNSALPNLLQEKENVKNKVGRPKKEKKETESHIKSRSMMANFLGKYVKPKNTQRSQNIQNRSDVSLPNKSDFERTFKPFLLKKDAELAPINWFTTHKNSQCSTSGIDTKHAIVVESDNETSMEPVEVKTTDNHLAGVTLSSISDTGSHS